MLLQIGPKLSQVQRFPGRRPAGAQASAAANTPPPWETRETRLPGQDVAPQIYTSFCSHLPRQKLRLVKG